jgi:hypothetical protein
MLLCDQARKFVTNNLNIAQHTPTIQGLPIVSNKMDWVTRYNSNFDKNEQL